MNLIICFTPLQVLIAERIIDLHPNEKFYGVMYNHHPSEKQTYYYHRLARKCVQTQLVYGSGASNKLQAYREMLKLLIKSYKLPSVKTIFIASLDLIDIHFLIHRFSNATIKTFDDGTLNLSPIAFERMMDKQGGGLQRILNLVLKIPSVQDLRNRSVQHYSIYKQPNVMGETTYIELFSKSDPIGQAKSPTRTRKVFLGQPIHELTDPSGEASKKATEYVIDVCSVQEYLPHPREPYRVEGVEYITTPLIAEDYFLQELRKSSEISFHIYTFCSSAILNLQHIPRLTFTAIKPNKCPEFLEEAYNAIEIAGIEVVELAMD